MQEDIFLHRRYYMKFNKTLCAVTAAAVLLTGTAFADAIDDSTQKISDGMNSFASTLLVVVPQVMTQQNVWADAYIGKLFPALPPHFGGGLSIAGTQLDMSGFKAAATALSEGYNSAASFMGTSSLPDFTIPDTFFLPTASLDIRLGGFFLPFDIGICAMMTNPSLFSVNVKDPDSILTMSAPLDFSFLGFDGSADYLMIGADVRYAVFEGNLVLPAVSVGIGYYFTKGAFSVNSNNDSASANMNIAFKTQVISLQAEVSKSFAIVTVYGGLRGILSDSTNNWAWDCTISGNKKSGEGTVTADGATTTYQDGKWDFSSIQPQIFAGVGFNFLTFQTTLGASYDLTWLYKKYLTDETVVPKNLWSGSFSFHVKL